MYGLFPVWLQFVRLASVMCWASRAAHMTPRPCRAAARYHLAAQPFPTVKTVVHVADHADHGTLPPLVEMDGLDNARGEEGSWRPLPSGFQTAGRERGQPLSRRVSLAAKADGVTFVSWYRGDAKPLHYQAPGQFERREQWHNTAKITVGTFDLICAEWGASGASARDESLPSQAGVSKGIWPIGALDVSKWGQVQHHVTARFGATKRPVPPRVDDVGTL